MAPEAARSGREQQATAPESCPWARPRPWRVRLRSVIPTERIARPGNQAAPNLDLSKATTPEETGRQELGGVRPARVSSAFGWLTDARVASQTSGAPPPKKADTAC